MSKANGWVALKDTLRQYFLWIITAFLDSIFLIVWAITQWLVNTKIISPLLPTLSLTDKFVLYVFQFLFSIATLAPVTITIYRDISIMILQTQRKIRREKIKR